MLKTYQAYDYFVKISALLLTTIFLICMLLVASKLDVFNNSSNKLDLTAKSFSNAFNGEKGIIEAWPLIEPVDKEKIIISLERIKNGSESFKKEIANAIGVSTKELEEMRAVDFFAKQVNKTVASSVTVTNIEQMGKRAIVSYKVSYGGKPEKNIVQEVYFKQIGGDWYASISPEPRDQANKI